MDASGLTFHHGDGGVTVFLNAQLSHHQRRFTLAHELAHIMLRPFLGSRGAGHSLFGVEQDPEAARIEVLCDAMASVLLMPEESVRLLQSDLRSAAAVKHLALKFDVSYEAAARRFLTLAPGVRALIVWQPSTNRIRTGRCVPCPALCDIPIKFAGPAENVHLAKVRLQAALVARGLPPLPEAEEAFSTDHCVTSHEDVVALVGIPPFAIPLALVESQGWGAPPNRYIYSFVDARSVLSDYGRTSTVT